MIGVSPKPPESSATRIAATRPSIMSLGATTSAPASAWLNAVRASNLSDASLSMIARLPRFFTTPQWPWLMYSHRQTSVMTSNSGRSCFNCRTAFCTMPFLA